jgi:hypothetical protein
LPTGTVTFKVTATDNNGATVTKQFTVKFILPPPLVVAELPRIVDITSLLRDKGLPSVTNITTPYSKDVPLISWIKTIDSNGLMEVCFNKPVIPVGDLRVIKTSDFNIRFEQNLFEVDQTKDFSWYVTYMDPFRILA